MRWEEQIVQLLLEQRQAGVLDFGVAWRRASSACPRPKDWSRRGHEDDPGWEPFSTFFREACRAEWNGRVRVDYIGLREMLADSSLTGSAGENAPKHRPGSSRAKLVA